MGREEFDDPPAGRDIRVLHFLMGGEDGSIPLSGSPRLLVTPWLMRLLVEKFLWISLLFRRDF